MIRAILAALFIAGICIGIAYFNVPILTGIIGFIPGTVMTVIVWVFTLSICLLYAEATLTQPDGANLASISYALLGRTWMVILSIFFIINVISYLASYAYVTTEFLQWFFQDRWHHILPPFAAELLSLLPPLIIIYLGVKFSIHVQALLMVGLFVSFILLCYWGSGSVVPSRLLESQWTYTIFSVPILFSAFGFAGIVPVICTYLKRNPFHIKFALWIGSVIPLIIYIFWQWFMLGSFSSDNFWVLFEKKASLDSVVALAQTIPHIIYPLNYLIFFSMITSLIGNGTTMVEFFSDLFKIPLQERKGWIRLGLSCLVFALTFLASFYKGQFFVSLVQTVTASLGAFLTNGIIPLIMVIQARYFYKLQTPRLLGGGTVTLFLLGSGLLLLLYLEGVDYISY